MQLNELLAQIDLQKAEIDRLRPLRPEVEHRIMQKFRLDWNYHSNAIEGNSLTLGETRAFLLEGLTANGKPMKDHLDIKGHDDLISFLELYIRRKDRLTEADIREMHKILLKEPYETEAVTPDGKIVKKKVRLGEYKAEPNFVRMASGEMHHYALPQDVGPKMADLVAWNEKEESKGDTHPIIRAALFHYRFVEIHPFDDGNGRMARVLMNLILMRAGFPPVVIKTQTRDQYVAALRRADAGETDGIVSFIGQNLLDAENLYLRGARGEVIEDADDIDREVALLKQELKDSPTPTSLTLEVQRNHIDQKLVSLLKRLDAKLVQFDELFAKSSCTLTATIRIADKFFAQKFQGARSQAPAFLQAVNTTGHIISRADFVFNFDGFMRDGSNDFPAPFDLTAIYEERKMSVGSNAAHFYRVFLYQTWFTEEEIQVFVNDYAKHLLAFVRKSRSNPKT